MTRESFVEVESHTLENGYPTWEMLFAKRPPKLAKNKIDGFADVEQYIDIQYQLLLEDFMCPLRHALKDFKISPHVKTFEGARVFRNITLKEPKDPLKRDGYTYILSGFKPSDVKSKELPSFGRLLLFTKTDFKTDLFLGKVISDVGNRQVKVQIQIHRSSYNPKGTYMILEATAFYFKYEHVLTALKGFDESNFPMKDYLIYGRKGNDFPDYIKNSTIYNVFGRSVNVALDHKWPAHELMQMNTSQCLALANALRSKVACIQGPPGTGKTHFAVRLVKVLLDNINVWNPSGRTPLIVVTQSNAALDHFLEGLLTFTTKLVRVGDRSESERLRPFFLNALLDRYLQISPLARRSDVRESILQSADVVGFTTTGASIRRYILDVLKSPIVIVEEAAQVMEADVVASMTKHCQHLILLGDHKQLKPCLQAHYLTDYDLDRSLFERLLINKVAKKSCLTAQYRMRPEISSLLKPHIYEHLDDAPTTLDIPHVPGLQKSVFFLDHNRPESTTDGKTGFYNNYEVEMLIQAAKYLVSKGFVTSQLTIISMYNEQRCKLTQERDKVPTLKNLEIASVDSFQGKENDIILLSLVRNNQAGKIGFLKEENRICVALSRAKLGLIIMGSVKCLTKEQWQKDGPTLTVWTNVLKGLQKQNAVGTGITLLCEKHNFPYKVSETTQWLDEFCEHCREERLFEEKRKQEEILEKQKSLEAERIEEQKRKELEAWQRRLQAEIREELKRKELVAQQRRLEAGRVKELKRKDLEAEERRLEAERIDELERKDLEAQQRRQAQSRQNELKHGQRATTAGAHPKQSSLNLLQKIIIETCMYALWPIFRKIGDCVFK